METEQKPVLVYDGDCDLCRFWIARWSHVTEDWVDYASSQESEDRFPDISHEQFQSSVQLVQPDGAVYDGAEAVFRTLACNPKHRWPLWCYRNLWGVAPVTEFTYRFVARHRGLFSRFTRALWGNQFEPSTYFLTRRVFLVSLGIVYCLAFLSLWLQIEGLVGSQGIMPAQEFFKGVEKVTGTERYWVLPSIFWLNAGDAFLNLSCLAGVFLSVCVITGFFVVPALILLWLFYLSLVTVGQEFMAFQWDVLLLETGFLAIFLASWRRRAKPGRESAPSPVVLFLYRFLLFRFMVSSGLVKIASGDETWRDGTALNFHYQTQPLPTWGGWYAHQLPEWFQKISVDGVYAVQLLVPFLIFAPRRLRQVACAIFVLFQLMIVATGNYGFFNLLTLALCLLLLDDGFWKKWLPERWAQPVERGKRVLESGIKKWAIGVVAGTVLMVSVTHHLLPLVAQGYEVPRVSQSLYGAIRHLHIVNSYGLFAVMTTRRPEIILEGSHDGETWQAYEFKWKPGNVKRAPEFVAPHQPRLDWQMWFAALGDIRRNPWVLQLMVRLLSGAEPVLQLLASNPFADSPPKFIRAVVYDYKFTDFSGWREDGSWWRREFLGLYAPVLQLPETAGTMD